MFERIKRWWLTRQASKRLNQLSANEIAALKALLASKTGMTEEEGQQRFGVSLAEINKKTNFLHKE